MPKPTRAYEGRAVDVELMFGEDSDSEFIDDALLWIHVYTELHRFTACVILDSERASEGLDFAARVNAEVERTSLRAQEARYRRRRAFWQHRAAELTNAALVRGRDGPAA